MSDLSRRRPGDWILVGEALAWLAVASAALRVARFETVARWACGAPRGAVPGASPDERLALRVAAAVRSAAGRAPWPAACFSQALACHVMLRRRGLPSRLFYGARNRGSLGPSAHVWVRSGPLPLVGAETAAQFALLAAFPPLEPAPAAAAADGAQQATVATTGPHGGVDGG